MCIPVFIVFVGLDMEDESSCFQNSVNAVYCSICARHGRRRKLQLCRLNSEEAVYICSYPEVSNAVICGAYWILLY